MTLYKAMSAVKRRELEAEIERLRAENAELRERMSQLEAEANTARQQAEVFERDSAGWKALAEARARAARPNCDIPKCERKADWYLCQEHRR